MESIRNWIKEVFNVVDDSIYDYVFERICKTDNKLVLAIEIYLILGDIFVYNSQYAFYKNFKYAKKVANINLENNQVVCNEWAIIYHKLLSCYGIKSKVNEDGVHYNVIFTIDGLDYKADATLFGVMGNYYCLSDLANMKYKFEIVGIDLELHNYLFQKEKSYNNDKKYLDQAIKEAYILLDKDIIKRRKIVDIENLIWSRIKVKREDVGKYSYEDFRYRIEIINKFYKMKISRSEIEKKQLLTKYSKNIFSDYTKEFLSDSYLYYLEDNMIRYYKLFIFKDIMGEIYYFLETEQGFLEYSKENLIEKILDSGLVLQKEEIIKGIDEEILRKFLIKT